MLAAVTEKAKSLRAVVYDVCIVPITSRWYREVLLQCPLQVTVLDVGIGTASSLIANRDVVLSKRLSVVGVDYDIDYVKNAQASIAVSSLHNSVRIEHANIHRFNNDYKELFDIIYFSGSFMILPDKSGALRHCTKMLRSPIPTIPEGGNIMFTQTLEARTLVGQYITPWVKRLLRACTTIDFGEVTYEDEFRAALAKADVEIVRVQVISASYFRKQVMVVARPRLPTEVDG